MKRERAGQRVNISSESPWEPVVGYSRAVRLGKFVAVAGTTATDDSGAIVGAGDPYLQTRFILEKIEGVLHRAGAKLSDVVRTRMFATDISHWQEIGRAHSEFFENIRPAATMVQVSALISKEMLVEIEAEALLSD